MTSTFGNGYFGVGDFGTATPIPFTGSTARTGFDSGASFVPRPVLRVFGQQEFRAESYSVRTVRAGPFGASSEFSAISNFWKGPVLEARALTNFGGSYYFDQSLPDRETMHLCHARPSFSGETGWAALLAAEAGFGAVGFSGDAGITPWAVLGASLARVELQGQSTAITMQPIRLNAGRIELQGRTGPGTVGVAFRASVGRSGLPGAARAQIWALSKRLNGRLGFHGASSVRARFVTELDTGRTTLRGVARTSYDWSNQTAPGRDPAPVWGGVSEPTDIWQEISANADNWQEI